MSRTTATPLVSIIVPNYNHARFLPERLASIRNQTFKDYELIVLDDASSDQSLGVIRAELADIPHQLIINEQNSGSPCSQWLKGIEQAQGRYVWIAESDDSCSPDFLDMMVKVMDQGASLAYCRSQAINEQGIRTPFIGLIASILSSGNLHSQWQIIGFVSAFSLILMSFPMPAQFCFVFSLLYTAFR